MDISIYLFNIPAETNKKHDLDFKTFLIYRHCFIFNGVLLTEMAQFHYSEILKFKNGKIKK